MTLESRTRFGPYEILAPLGSGGMGEVYRARDTRLGRDVAVKVLPGHLASSPGLRDRFDREARAISSLSHPHICALYDVGHQDGTDFLVMECLEGETLADRLTRGALPLDQVLRYGSEIASGLDHAHRQGIVHRDLKPGNVMLTRTGAKLLDFGIALDAARLAEPGQHEAATVSAPLTAAGSVLGTFQYMAPEQLEGRTADTRSDIFALGAVLHEMATGVRAFAGKTTASVIASILERDPPAVSSLQPLAPPGFDDVVRGCLAKDPEERWQTAHDVKLQLESLRRRAGEPAAAPSRTRSRRGWIAWTLAGLVMALAAVAGVRNLTQPPPPAAALLRASLLPPAGHSFVPGEFAISPDGRRIAFVAVGRDGSSTLWTGALESAQPSEVSGSENARHPFWSADSRSVAFFAGDKLKRVDLEATGVHIICEANISARWGAWGPDNVILFSNAPFGPLWRVSADGGAAVAATSIPEDALGEAHRFPQFLGDGRRFLYVASWTTEQRGGVYLASLDGGTATVVSSAIRGRVLLAEDLLLFVQAGTLYAQPFDQQRGVLTGSPRAVARNEIVVEWEFGSVPMSVSRTGTLVFQSRLAYNSRLVWYDRDGRELGTVGEPGFSMPALSPDGRRVAVSFDRTGYGQPSLWIHDLPRDVATQVTADGLSTAHAWSPDGRWLAYSIQRRAEGVYRRASDGSGQEETLVESPAHLLVNSWSRDGRQLLYMDFSEGRPGLRSYDFATRTSRTLGIGAEASFSPDGQWITFIGVPDGLWMTRASGDGARVRVTGAWASQARWRADGKELFYIGDDRKMMSVPITVRNGTPEPGVPVPLFQTRIVHPRLALFQYDVTADGQRFLVNSLPAEDAAAPLTLLVNWTAGLAR